MSYGAPGFITLGPRGSDGVPSVPQDAPKAMFRYGEQSIWSTQAFDGGAAVAGQPFRLFSTQGGQAGQGYQLGLSLAETNLKLPGQVPGGVAYDVFGVSAQVLHSSVDDADTAAFNRPCITPSDIGNLTNILNNGVFSWDFTQTTVQIAPLMLIGAGGGEFGAVATSQNQERIGAMNNGNGSVWLYRTYPVALPGTTVFGIVLQFGTRAAAMLAVANGGGATAVRCVLLGYYKNVIEIG